MGWLERVTKPDLEWLYGMMELRSVHALSTRFDAGFPGTANPEVEKEVQSLSAGTTSSASQSGMG